MIAPFVPRSRGSESTATEPGPTVTLSVSPMSSTGTRLSVPVNAREPERKPAEDESSRTGDTPSADSEKMEYEAAANVPVLLRPVPGGRVKAVTLARYALAIGGPPDLGERLGPTMNLSEYIVLFVCVAIMGAGVPGLGDAALIGAGTLAGEGKLNVWAVLATAMVAWMLGSLGGYEIGLAKGRWLLDHPGRLEKSRRKLLAKGDRVFGRHNFVASVTMPAFVSGIFKVRFWVFVLGALVAGVGWIGMYVGLSYFLGAEIAKRIGNAGTKAVLGVLVIVAIGLGIRAAYSRWRAARSGRSVAQDPA